MQCEPAVWYVPIDLTLTCKTVPTYRPRWQRLQVCHRSTLPQQADDSDSDGLEFTPSDEDIQLVDDIAAHHIAEARNREQQNDYEVSGTESMNCSWCTRGSFRLSDINVPSR